MDSMDTMDYNFQSSAAKLSVLGSMTHSMTRLSDLPGSPKKSATLGVDTNLICRAQTSLRSLSYEAVRLEEEERMHQPLALSPRCPAGTAVEFHADRLRRVPLHLMSGDRQARGFVSGERGLQPCLDHGPVLPVRGTEY